MPQLLFITSLLTTVVLTIWTYTTPPNYVYAVTKLNQQEIALLSLYLGLVILLARTGLDWWRQHYQKFFLLSPLLITAVLALISLWPFNFFLEFVKEDHPIENLQVIILLIGVTVLWWRLWRNRYTASLLSKAWVIIMILALVFIAGDEISWGQRLLGISTPESLRQINLQEETTFHNIRGIQGLTELGYLVIGLFGSFSWIFKKYVPRRFQFLVIPAYLAPLFFTQVLYYSYPYYWGENRLKHWSEVMELYFYLGLTSYAVVMAYRLCKQAQEN